MMEHVSVVKMRVHQNYQPDMNTHRTCCCDDCFFSGHESCDEWSGDGPEEYIDNFNQCNCGLESIDLHIELFDINYRCRTSEDDSLYCSSIASGGQLNDIDFTATYLYTSLIDGESVRRCVYIPEDSIPDGAGPLVGRFVMDEIHYCPFIIRPDGSQVPIFTEVRYGRIFGEKESKNDIDWVDAFTVEYIGTTKCPIKIEIRIVEIPDGTDTGDEVGLLKVRLTYLDGNGTFSCDMEIFQTEHISGQGSDDIGFYATIGDIVDSINSSNLGLFATPILPRDRLFNLTEREQIPGFPDESPWTDIDGPQHRWIDITDEPTTVHLFPVQRRRMRLEISLYPFVEEPHECWVQNCLCDANQWRKVLFTKFLDRFDCPETWEFTSDYPYQNVNAIVTVV